jgi:putative nucleotidyltransferase with HDIG domain
VSGRLPWRARLGLDELRFGAGDGWRVVLLLATCVVCAILLTDWTGSQRSAPEVGEVAPRSVRAPFTFSFPDRIGWATAQEDAAAAVPEVWTVDPTEADRLAGQVATAFAVGRAGGSADAVRQALGVHVPDDVVTALNEAGWPARDEAFTSELVRAALARPVAAARPAGETVALAQVGAPTLTLRASEIATLAEAREAVDLRIAAAPVGAAAAVDAVTARALLRVNCAADPAATEVARQRAAAHAALGVITVPRGASIVRQGDVVTEAQRQTLAALDDARGRPQPLWNATFLALFLLLLLASLYQFGSTWLGGFRTRTADIAAAGALLALVSASARGVVLGSEGVAALVGYEAERGSVWFVTPVAGAVMLVRLLLGTAWTVAFSVAAAVACGLVMDFQALPVIYFLITGVAAGSVVEGTRERASVVRAGLTVGLVGAAAALVIHFVQLFVVEGEASLAATIRPVWSTAFAFAGGILSAFLVLGLMPLFEGVGFVTDYRLMELANLNHPLLRQVMLRAPGTYHHSVLVGTLAEAACEAIGANALEAKVAAYFHDIGKSVKPLYFIENQNGVNRHAQLDPTRSAQIIISHVVDGGRMAREHGLPAPIIDNIFMHHGTGQLTYFFEEAKRRAGPDGRVDPADFRYPGPKPNTREAGVILLADKVEAATRTIRQPTEHAIRAMIQRILNATVADGQLDECPLTVREIAVSVDVFTRVLVGIYHQRIEYAATADLSRGEAPEPVITLELPVGPPDLGALGPVDEPSDAVDYESVEHLPRREG